MESRRTRVLRAEASPSASVPPVEATASVRYNKPLSSGRFLLGLDVKMPAARPGQFIMLGLPPDCGLLLRRPFSVLSHDSARRLLEVVYSVEGRGTLALSSVARGQTLSILGPLGTHFPMFAAEGRRRPGGATPLLRVLVAGGRGIAPLIFLADGIASAGKTSPGQVLFLAGARTAEELVLIERLKATEVFVSTDDGTSGRKGTVIELLQTLDRRRGRAGTGKAASPRERPGAVVYGCGPAGMLRELHSYCVSKRLPCYVSLEARMACGMGVCQGCAVRSKGSRFALVCKDGPVFESGLIDWKRYEGI